MSIAIAFKGSAEPRGSCGMSGPTTGLLFRRQRRCRCSTRRWSGSGWQRHARARRRVWGRFVRSNGVPAGRHVSGVDAAPALTAIAVAASRPVTSMLARWKRSRSTAACSMW